MIALAFAALAGLAAQAPAQLTARQLRGRAIYVDGKGGQPVVATVGAAGGALPATLLPCISCHGEEGRGRREGGVSAADLTRASLWQAAIVGGRSRPSYTDALLKRAIATGRDAAGQALDRAMPRYRMSARDAGDLLAYLAILGSEAPPGVGADVVRINVVGAPGLTAPTQTVYGRRIELHHGRGAEAFMTIDASPDGAASTIAAERDRMPTIVLDPGAAAPGRYTLALAASREDQAAALRQYAASRSDGAVPLAEDCRGLQTKNGAALVLMTANVAAQCSLESIPVALDRKVVVAAAAPPGAEAVAKAQLAIVVATLQRLGREFTRKTFMEALEHSYRLEAPGLPPLTWSASRRHGASQVWLMTLDVRRRALLAEPGWWPAPPH